MEYDSNTSYNYRARRNYRVLKLPRPDRVTGEGGWQSQVVLAYGARVDHFRGLRATLAHPGGKFDRRLEAKNEEALRERVYDHLRRESPAIVFDDARTYRYESVAVYSDGVVADEGFGPDPY